MSTQDRAKKLELVKAILKDLHGGTRVDELKERFKQVLEMVSPFEIPLIEQELVKEGVPITDILKLCDLHVELFREFLQARELENVPIGHPVYFLIKENELLLKESEILEMLARVLSGSVERGEVVRYLSELAAVLRELRRKVRYHYRKIQMLLFPYLERRGIVAVPRVLWGREDQVVVKLRELEEAVDSLLNEQNVEGTVKDLARRAQELAREISELVFRENKILYPAALTLLSEGEWVAIAEEARKFPWLVQIDSRVWNPAEKPVMPYELATTVSEEQIEKLPPEFKFMALSRGVEPDNYEIRRGGDLDLGTGFLDIEELRGLFRALPIEITFANRDDRVKFYSESMLSRGFDRARTIIGRRVEFCHPPRLELTVRKVVDSLKRGEAPFREFWTKSGDRILRVIIVPIKNDTGEIIGTAEVVEDLTEVINKAEEIKKKVVVL
ncbi:MAG: DUF438 domain-containing protein [Sulfolobales archaeon]